MAANKKYETVTVTGAFVRVGAGVTLKLSKQQATDRAYGVENKGRGLYETTRMVEFKQGESFKIALECLEKIALSRVAVGKEAEQADSGSPDDAGDDDNTPDDVGDDMDPTADGSLSK